MSYTLAPQTIRKIGSIYSWLIRQPSEVVQSVHSVIDAEKRYDEYLASDALNSSATARCSITSAIGSNAIGSKMAAKPHVATVAMVSSGAIARAKPPAATPTAPKARKVPPVAVAVIAAPPSDPVVADTVMRVEATPTKSRRKIPTVSPKVVDTTFPTISE